MQSTHGEHSTRQRRICWGQRECKWTGELAWMTDEELQPPRSMSTHRFLSRQCLRCPRRTFRLYKHRELLAWHQGEAHDHLFRSEKPSKALPSSWLQLSSPVLSCLPSFAGVCARSWHASYCSIGANVSHQKLIDKKTWNTISAVYNLYTSCM